MATAGKTTTGKRGGFGNYNVGAITRRILKVYRGATDGQVLEGLSWYSEARQACAELQGRHGGTFTLEQVAYAMAALSPQVTWGQNLQACADALHLYRAGWRGRTLPGYTGYRENVGKTVRILSGDLDALGGPKVTAFASAILGDLSHVVVDVWATRAARDTAANLLRAYYDDEMPGAVERRAIAEGYRRAAAAAGIAPAEMQAVVWVAVRESDGWQRPQHMGARAKASFYRRQARARAAAGLAVSA